MFFRYILYTGDTLLMGEMYMFVFLNLVFLLNFVVDFLLLISTNRLVGFPQRWGKLFSASLLGAMYGAVCMIPTMRFLGNSLWRMVFLLLIGVTAFGFSVAAIRKCVLFAMMNMALGGIAMGLNAGGFLEIVSLCLMLCVLCYIGFRGNAGAKEYVNVTLRHNDNTVELTALQDTGNTLRDPITGQSVMILSADIAKALLGLTEKQLRNPVDTMAEGKVGGLRLLPYHTIGNSSDFLLAKRMEHVKIGNWQGSCIVAFSAEKLDREGLYQALTGGVI